MKTLFNILIIAAIILLSRQVSKGQSIPGYKFNKGDTIYTQSLFKRSYFVIIDTVGHRYKVWDLKTGAYLETSAGGAKLKSKNRLAVK